jgi:type IV pilus assembly protein PilA
MKTIQKGFTLIELMIVVAIIAILAAIAIPAYQDYVIRTQVSEGMTLADGAKTALSEFYSNKGVFPGANESAGLAQAASILGKYVSGVQAGTTNGVIVVSFNQPATNAAIKTSTLGLSAVTHAGSVSWSCTGASTTINKKYLPSSCRT